MAANAKKFLSVDIRSVSDKARRQFVGLDPNDPSLWPILPRSLLFLAVGVAVCAGAGVAVGAGVSTP